MGFKLAMRRKKPPCRQEGIKDTKVFFRLSLTIQADLPV